MTLDKFRQSLTATDPPPGLTFGRNPCRSSSPRRSLYRVFLAASSSICKDTLPPRDR
jgi:hypothetical protein